MNQAIGRSDAFDVLITGRSASTGYSRTCCRRALTVVMAASRLVPIANSSVIVPRESVLSLDILVTPSTPLSCSSCSSMISFSISCGLAPGQTVSIVQRGDLHVGDELDRHPADGDQPEHHQQDHEDRDLDGVLDEVLDEAHDK